MKKDHNSDSPRLTKAVSIVAIIAICISTIATSFTAYKMSKMSVGTVTVQSATPGSSSNSSAKTDSVTPTPSGDNSSNTSAPANTDTPASTETPASSGADPKEVLAAYTEVMDKFKSSAKTCKKKEFQALPELNLGSSIVEGIAKPIISNIMKTEDQVEEQQLDGDMKWVPLYKSTKGCAMTDPSAIKSCSMKADGDKTTIEIVLNTYTDSQPAKEDGTNGSDPVGQMFQPLNKEDIDSTLAGIPALTVNTFKLDYHDCKATLVYKTDSKELVSLDQEVPTSITANVKAAIVTVDATAELIMYAKFYDATY